VSSENRGSVLYSNCGGGDKRLVSVLFNVCRVVFSLRDTAVVGIGETSELVVGESAKRAALSVAETAGVFVTVATSPPDG
jgi:hypothetical protein